MTFNLTTRRSSAAPMRRGTYTASLTLATLLLASACGGASTGGATNPQSQQTQEPGGQSPRLPGASGTIAALSGNTLQIQSSDAQTTVTFSKATTFSNTVGGSLADVTVGSCVMVRSADSSNSDAASTISASSVTITTASSGSCTGSLGGGGGNFTPPAGFTPPPGFTPPSGAPNGRPGGFGGGAFGKVVSISASGFVVESNLPAGGPGSSQGSTSQITVTSAGQTTYTKQVSATGSALKIGLCATAQGEQDETGAITATSIAVRPATNGSCDTGFGRGGFGGAPGA